MYTRPKRVELKKKRFQWLTETKRNKPCVDCAKIFHPVCMDYHHLDPETKHKENGVRGLIKGGYSMKRIQEEIDKCILLCSNCHRLRHYANDEEDDF